MSHLLDNPVWHSLTGPHRHLAIGAGSARHYPRDLAPFSAIESDSASAYADLAIDLSADAEARLFRPGVEPLPTGWMELDSFAMMQMVCTANHGLEEVGLPVSTLEVRDSKAMLELAAIAKPGPFGARTGELGRYVGVWEGGRLIAMAGERMRVPGHVELSAICTHPDARGRRLAERLTMHLVRAALQRGEVPFLHVRPDNTAAVSLYRRLGFEVRAQLRVVWRKPLADRT